jgi:hypothetical protein
MGKKTEADHKKRRGKHSALYRARLAKDLRSSLRVHETEIVDRWEELLVPYLEGDERLELRTLVRATNRMIADRIEQLEESEKVHLRELEQDSNLREQRRHWAGELRRVLITLRDSSHRIFGKAATETFLGIEGRTARDLVGLQRQGRRVVDRITDPTRPKPKPRTRGTPIDWDQLKEEVEEPLHELERTDRALRVDEDETETALGHKRRDRELYDRQVHAAARWLMATYELVGYEKAQRRLLPESRGRRRSRRAARIPEAVSTVEAAESPNREDGSE